VGKLAKKRTIEKKKDWRRKWQWQPKSQLATRREVSSRKKSEKVSEGGIFIREKVKEERGLDREKGFSEH